MCSYSVWATAVDDWCWKLAGVSVHDLADCPLMDWYEHKVSPQSAAKRAIRRDVGE